MSAAPALFVGLVMKRGVRKQGFLAPRSINVRAALASFDEVYSPRIVARINDYQVKVPHVRGDHVWHVHEDTDEFFLVLDGTFEVSFRDPAGDVRAIAMARWDTLVVPRGVEHRPSSTGGSILFLEPAGTLNIGDHHQGEIPEHVDVTSGHDLA